MQKTAFLVQRVLKRRLNGVDFGGADDAIVGDWGRRTAHRRPGLPRNPIQLAAFLVQIVPHRPLICPQSERCEINRVAGTDCTAAAVACD
eukprot:134859-Rhodomonas_salina.1